MTTAELIVSMTACITMVLATVWVHYEVLTLLSRRLLPRIKLKGRSKVGLAVVGLFAAHTVEVWLYALCYWILVEHLHWGTLDGEMATGAFLDYLYFSTATYTSLGLGDISPLGAIRLLTGVEALNGLLLIGWSASFTYLMMEKFWATPKR